MENILMISTKYLCDIIPDDSKSLFWIKNQIILSSNKNNYYMSYKEELIHYFSEDECMYILDFLHDSFVDIIMEHYTDFKYMEHYKKMAVNDTIINCSYIINE